MRLLRLDKMMEGLRCARELVEEVGIDKSFDSKRLSQLKSAGFIDDQKWAMLTTESGE